MGVGAKLRFVSVSVALLLGAGCGKTPAPISADLSWQVARASYEHGEYKKALGVVDDALRHGANAQPDLLWRLRLLQAEILLTQGLSRDALNALAPAHQPDPQDPTLRALRSALQASAEAYLQQFELAQKTFASTERMQGAQAPEVLGELLLGEGRLAAFRHDPAKAEQLFKQAFLVGQQRNQPFLAARAQMNLGILQMLQGHYAEAADLFNASLVDAQTAGAQAILVKLAVNLGWAYRRMGDSERANELFQQAEENATKLGMISDQTAALTNIAVIQLAQRNYPAAEQEYRQALQLARQSDNQQEAAYSLTNLALTAIEEHNFDTAEKYNAEALALERTLADHDTEMYSVFNEAQIAFGRKDFDGAEEKLQAVVRGSGSDLGLQANALRVLANLHAQRNQPEQAQALYASAIVALEKGRESLGRDELKLPYPAKSKDVYDDYIDFLVEQHKSDEAFRLAELRRARTLTEGLGFSPLRTQAFSRAEAEQAAGRSGHVILSYWIGTRRSYVWALLPGRSRFVVLPGESEIRPLVERYRAHLLGAFDGGNIANVSGQQLYNTLIGPVEDLIEPQAKVTIIADGPLCQLNFETLVVSSPRPHYWIEDVSVTNASSAVLLAMQTSLHQPKAPPPGKMLLLIGNPRQPANYPALTHAGEEMHLVQAHYPAAQETVLSGAEATPAAYFRVKPEDYALIHFVAHGTASRVNPLDSAVVLSQDGATYNLYARDIARNKLRARLVTISACDSAGSRIYSSEGLVGLSWGFLRAGAQQVIASMWEVNDTSTPQLMDRLYSAMEKGDDPAAALREGKLALLRSGTVQARPFYWAPFLLYQGVRTG